MAGLALRNGAIQRIELDHISWRSAELRVPTTKGGKGLVLPLSQEVGDALSDYILHERPKSKSRVVFLRHTRPHGALMSKSTITEMIKARLRSEGIKGPGGATTLLRHSLATQLVNSGVPIKDISDTFGHSSINTTAIYSKVHYSALAGRASVPGLGGSVMAARLAERVATYLDLQRPGLEYIDEAKILRQFQRDCAGRLDALPISQEMVMAFATNDPKRSAARSWKRYDVVRRFAQYLAVFEPGSSSMDLAPFDVIGASLSRTS